MTHNQSDWSPYAARLQRPNKPVQYTSGHYAAVRPTADTLLQQAGLLDGAEKTSACGDYLDSAVSAEQLRDLATSFIGSITSGDQSKVTPQAKLLCLPVSTGDSLDAINDSNAIASQRANRLLALLDTSYKTLARQGRTNGVSTDDPPARNP